MAGVFGGIKKHGVWGLSTDGAVGVTTVTLCPLVFFFFVFGLVGGIAESCSFCLIKVHRITDCGAMAWRIRWHMYETGVAGV